MALRLFLNPTVRLARTRGFATAPLLNMKIDVSKLTVKRTTQPKPRVAKEKLVFGQTMSDHILEIDWDADNGGWGAPTITPYHNLSLDPACSVFHYGMEAFEGMKAYSGVDNQVRLFRPDLNMKRLGFSMDMLSLPKLDQQGFLDCIIRLVQEDKSWIPQGEGFSLYIRPTVIGTQPTLGVSQSRKAKLYCICSPVGPYYPEGFKPVKLLAEQERVRAWPGGLGNAKVGGNYAPTILVQSNAAKKGYSQVLWLFGPNNNVTEVGTMNFFVLLKNKQTNKPELLTAPLDDGTILHGVTRQSILDLTRQWTNELTVTERPYTINEVLDAAKEGRIIEAFGSGTAAVVSPVKGISFKGVDTVIPLDLNDPAQGAGPLTRRLWNSLADIQYGRAQKGPLSELSKTWTVPV